MVSGAGFRGCLSIILAWYRQQVGLVLFSLACFFRTGAATNADWNVNNSNAQQHGNIGFANDSNEGDNDDGAETVNDN